jgi:hypothetical protein
MNRLMMLAVIATLALPAWGQDKKDEKKDAAKTDECTDDEAKAQIAEFQKEWKKAKGVDDQISAVATLAKKKHSKILEELKKYLATGQLDVRITAAEEIGKYKKEPKAADVLLATSKAAVGRKETLEFAVKCMRYLGNTAVRAKGKELPPLFGQRETDFVKEVLDTCGMLKSKDTIDPIINLVLELESVKEETSKDTGGTGTIPGGTLPGGNNPGGQKDEDINVKRKKELTNPGIQALKDITGEKYNTGKEWKAWWGKNRTTFKELDE